MNDKTRAFTKRFNEKYKKARRPWSTPAYILR